MYIDIYIYIYTYIYTYIYYYREDSGLVANEQRSQHKLVMALCYAMAGGNVTDSWKL